MGRRALFLKRDVSLAASGQASLAASLALMGEQASSGVEPRSPRVAKPCTTRVVELRLPFVDEAALRRWSNLLAVSGGVSLRAGARASLAVLEPRLPDRASVAESGRASPREAKPRSPWAEPVCALSTRTEHKRYTQGIAWRRHSRRAGAKHVCVGTMERV
eukprot:333143-Pleurochrysis_carterae.AAC.2